MSSYKEDLILAYKFVNCAARAYDEEKHPYGYACLLIGVGHFHIGDFDKKHNYRAVVDAIHLYKKNNPTRSVEEAYRIALSEITIMVAGPKAVNNLFNILEYELSKEKDGKNSFVLDFAPVLKDMEKLGQRGISRRKRTRILGEDYALKLETLKKSVAAAHPKYL